MSTRLEHAKARIGKCNDARRRISDDDRTRIKQLHEAGISIRAITREVGCSRRSVQFILFPERLSVVREQFAERQKDGRYYTKEKHSIYMQRYRARLVSLGRVTKTR